MMTSTLHGFQCDGFFVQNKIGLGKGCGPKHFFMRASLMQACPMEASTLKQCTTHHIYIYMYVCVYLCVLAPFVELQHDSTTGFLHASPSVNIYIYIERERERERERFVCVCTVGVWICCFYMFSIVCMQMLQDEVDCMAEVFGAIGIFAA